MNPQTLIPCGCCNEETPEYPTVYDGDLGKLVCADCAQDLRNAADALRANGIPPVYHGPFPGNSVG